MNTRQLFEEHISLLQALAELGDPMAAKSLCCMSLLVEGFPDDGGDGGGTVVYLEDYLKAA
jgi:hypothetical protein